MKKLALLILTAISLTGCLGGDDAIQSDELVNHQSALFTINYPAGWNALTAQEIQVNLPDNTLAAFRSVDSVNGVFPNITIVEEAVSEDLLSYEYARLSIEKAPQTVDNFNTIARNDVEINGKETIIFIYMGRIEAQNRDMQFFQTFFTKGGRGIIVTGVCSPDSDQDLKDLIEQSVRSFQFREN